MKKVVALFLTLAMLLSIVGTVAVGAEEVKPTLAYPAMTATVSEEGLLTVKFDDDVKNYSINDIRLEKEEGSTWASLYESDYDAEKKAYVTEVGTDWAGAEVTLVNANLNEWKDEKISENQYRYENGKISYVAKLTGTYKSKGGEGSNTTDAEKSGRGESYYYDEDGKLCGYGFETITNTSKNAWTQEPYKSEDSGKGTTEYKDYDADEKLNRYGTRTNDWDNTWGYDADDNWFNTSSNSNTDEYTENFWAGTAPFLTGKHVDSHSDKSASSVWTYQNHTDESIYNTKGVLIYKKVDDNAYDGNSNTSSYDGKLYDAYGNLLYGRTRSDKPAEETYSYYRKNGLDYTSTYTYDTYEGGARKNNNYTSYTYTGYSWDDYGNHWKSYERTQTPTTVTYKDANENERTYSYTATTTTNYDKNGGVTNVTEHTEDKTYDKEQKAFVTTKTDKTYVGKASDGELKQTEVTTEVRDNDYYGPGNYKQTTVTTDYTGAVVKEKESSNIHTPATETAKETRVEKNITKENGKQTSGTISTYTYDYDDKGHTSYTSVTTNEDGKITQSVDRVWDEEAEKYVTTTSYNDENGILRGKETATGNSTTVFTDKDGKVLYKRDYTESTYKDGKLIPASATYTDADGKEIGYEKYTDYSRTSYKIPQILYGKTNLALNGWTVYDREEQKDEKDQTKYKYTYKTLDQAENLLREQVDDELTGKETETYYSKYDAGMALASDTETKNEDSQWTTSVTFNQNPGYVKSKTITKTPTEVKEKDDKKRTTKTERTITTEYFDLAGKVDRSVTETTTATRQYEDDSDTYGEQATNVTVTEWKDATGATVVTRTRNNMEAKSGENSVEYKKADGTVIGYEKTTKNDDGTTTRETVTADFNPYTGYVRSTSKEVYVENKRGERVKRTYERDSGSEKTIQAEEKTDDGDKGTETWYYAQEDGSMALSWDNAWEWNEKEKSNTWSGHSYYPSGKVARTWEGNEKYDPESTARTHQEVSKNANGEVVLTVEGTITEIAQYDHRMYDEYNEYELSEWDVEYFRQGSAEVRDLVYKDAKGNVIGYEKTDEKGNLVSKTPYYYDEKRADGDERRLSKSGKVAKGWREAVEDVWGNVLSEKYYDENGVLREESQKQADKESSAEYWQYTGEKKTTRNQETAKGISTTVTSYYNEDGTLRWKTVKESGRATGTHVSVNKTTVTDASGAVIYTYEQSRDLRTDLINGVYKDASGKEIGHYTEDTENYIDPGTRVYSELKPLCGRRTGKITGFIEKSVDEEGVRTEKEYDANMKLLSSEQTKTDKTEEGYWATSYYRNGSETPWKVETRYEDVRSIYVRGDAYYDVEGDYTETAYYNKAGTKIASENRKDLEQGLVGSETKYFNQKGELVYTRLEMRDLNGKGEYDSAYGEVYLDANGNEIGRYKQEDNGDRVEKRPATTYANNITGYYETVTSEDGTVTITREYDEDNVLTGETYRKEGVVLTDDTITRTTSKKDGTVVSKMVVTMDEDMVATKIRQDNYSAWNGRYTGGTVSYPSTDDYRYPAYKNYDENANMTAYGWNWSENDYDYVEAYWPEGNLRQYRWSDELGETGYHNEQYNREGGYAYWFDSDGNGNSQEWRYYQDGTLAQYTESKDGVTNITYYDKYGNVSGYDWAIVEGDEPKFHTQDSEVWSATSLLYKKHVESDPDNAGMIETWTDNSGNVKVRNAEGSKVTLTDMADGWHSAFGEEWYYVEGGQFATGWKNLGGVWYYFNADGSMATGRVKDGNSIYAMAEDGSWTSSGWNMDANGNWQYVENGVAVTGWKKIGGKWFYFDDGWYVNDYDWTYDDQIDWQQGIGGNMATGAVKIWNGSWTDQETWFFNSDGTWDTTGGWKCDGENWYYFAPGGQRATGWKMIDGNWYYFNNKGVMCNGWSGWYYLGENGEMLTSQWFQERFEDDWYYVDETGLAASGWKKIDGNWYYFGDDGIMASDEWVQSGSDWYYQKEDGAMATGWEKADDEGNWYYFGDSGAMQKGWVQDGNTWYYTDEEGKMVTGTQTIDGRVNIFDENGAWIGYGD